MTVQEMIATHPRPLEADRDALVRCVEECFDCGATCTSCADACLGEEDPASLVRCIRLNLDCADVCAASGRVLARQTAAEPALLRAALQACAEACRLCGEECAGHAEHHEHCRVCAEACHRCEQACNDLLATIG
ncbi:MAG TPA: four-helix bundle copper-binding protein [Gaiellaceae bacterium]|nr:four-helix bundle copper-binding protein [Gaiellaceae bacterium]